MVRKIMALIRPGKACHHGSIIMIVLKQFYSLNMPPWASGVSLSSS